MTISPISGIGSLITPTRGGVSEHEPTSHTPSKGSGSAATPTGGAVQTETKTAVAPTPSAPSAAKANAKPPSPQDVATRQQDAKADLVADGSGAVLKPDEVPPTEEVLALQEARKRAEVMQDSLAMRALIASLEMAVATRVPTVEHAEEAEPPVAQPAPTDTSNPLEDHKVDVRY